MRVTIDSGQFPLIRNVDHGRQPERATVHSRWLRIYADEIPRALEHLPDVIADCLTFGVHGDDGEKILKRLGLLELKPLLEEAAKTIHDLKDRLETVSGSGDSPVSAEDKQLRERVETFALSDAADPWHRERLKTLYHHWHRWNGKHFGSALTTPVIRLAEPSSPPAFGQYAHVSSIGGAGEICIRPSLLRGTHPMWEEPPTDAQALVFSQDVLLHEMIHQWQQEVTSNPESGYHGHGPDFRDKCNQIGAELEMPPVRSCKKRGKDSKLPSCSQWPHCVRPSGYAGSIR